MRYPKTVPYRLIYIFAVIVLIVITACFAFIDIPPKRYHQHLEEAGYTPCTDHGEEVFCTHLPLLNIVTQEPVPAPYPCGENGNSLRNESGLPVVNDTVVFAKVDVFDSQTKNNHLTDTPSISENAAIRVSGHSSELYDEMEYLLTFVTEDGLDGLDVPLVGMTADSVWALQGPVPDKTLIRNYVCYNLAGSVMDYVPNVRFCELFLNHEYMGVFLIAERISYSDSGRVHLSQSNPLLPETSYILKLDTGEVDESLLLNTFNDYTGRRGLSTRKHEWLEVVYPVATLTQEQKQAIEYEISGLEKALASFDSADRELGYPAYLNVDSFAKFFVFNEFVMNTDAGRLSTYFCKDVRGKISIVGWDYNKAFNNSFEDLTLTQEIYSTNKWYNYMLKDKGFTERVINIYNRWRSTILSEEFLSGYIDDVVDYLGPAVERNFERWEHTFTYDYIERNPNAFMRPLERNPQNYEEAIRQMRAAITDRGQWMDQYIDILYARSHDSANKQFRLPGDD